MRSSFSQPFSLLGDDQEKVDLFWGTQVTRIYIDPFTFLARRDVVSYPRIEDSSYETTGFAFSQPRFPFRTSLQDDGRREEKSSQSNPTSDGSTNGRQPTTPSPQQTRRSRSLPANQSTSRPKDTSKSPIPYNTKPSSRTNKSSPTTKQKPKTSSDTSLAAFLHRNTVQKIIQEEAAKFLRGKDDGGDTRSTGSKSMASMSVSDRSHAERSKAEESLARQAKERRAAKGKRFPGGEINGSLHKENQSLAMASIDEMSTSDFSDCNNVSSQKSCKPASLENSPKMKGSLDGFLSNHKAEEESSSDRERNHDTADAASVISASTLGSTSISARSKAEQSGTEKKLRQRRKFAMAEVVAEEDGEEDDNIKEDDRKIGQIDNASEGSGDNSVETENLDDSLDLEEAVVPTAEKSVRFRDQHSEKYISQELTYSMYDDLFWTSEELAEFRYEAFMEEAGLDINEFS
ncbi:hypothetical protein IV203_009249 [Nitzschia inconspicua]|uniref:Uncharacterized protein n=1 Tax=Nitzschia inconspicua TaxID=303405 RepID=A0A9K3PMR8_9STRA|nr:hypothetical protein IV203_011058 [Nitzschia inconspicua]KAG7353200.1 hypothetical protein IV203_009249 [Nitzschia inconspicua]